MVDSNCKAARPSGGRTVAAILRRAGRLALIVAILAITAGLAATIVPRPRFRAAAGIAEAPPSIADAMARPGVWTFAGLPWAVEVGTSEGPGPVSPRRFVPTGEPTAAESALIALGPTALDDRATRVDLGDGEAVFVVGTVRGVRRIVAGRLIHALPSGPRVRLEIVGAGAVETVATGLPTAAARSRRLGARVDAVGRIDAEVVEVEGGPAALADAWLAEGWTPLGRSAGPTTWTRGRSAIRVWIIDAGRGTSPARLFVSRIDVRIEFQGDLAVKTLVKFAIPIGIGVLAAAFNYLAVTSQTAKHSYVVSTRKVEIGEALAASGLDLIELPGDPARYRATLIPGEERGVIVGTRAQRVLYPGDPVFWRDIKPARPWSLGGPDDHVLPIDLTGLAVETSLLSPGDRIDFLVAPTGEEAIRQNYAARREVLREQLRVPIVPPLPMILPGVAPPNLPPVPPVPPAPAPARVFLQENGLKIVFALATLLTLAALRSLLQWDWADALLVRLLPALPIGLTALFWNFGQKTREANRWAGFAFHGMTCALLAFDWLAINRQWLSDLIPLRPLLALAFGTAALAAGELLRRRREVPYFHLFQSGLALTLYAVLQNLRPFATDFWPRPILLFGGAYLALAAFYLASAVRARQAEAAPVAENSPVETGTLWLHSSALLAAIFAAVGGAGQNGTLRDGAILLLAASLLYGAAAQALNQSAFAYITGLCATFGAGFALLTLSAPTWTMAGGLLLCLCAAGLLLDRRQREFMDIRSGLRSERRPAGSNGRLRLR